MSAVSNPKEPKTSTNFCILCAVREELTYICRVCLTKVYPLFQAGKSLSSKVFYFRDESLSSVFRQGRVYPLKFFILEMKVSSVLVGREVLSSVSGREEFIL